MDFFTKGITEIESKGIYEGYLIKKLHYCSKVVRMDLIDDRSQNKEVGNADVLEAKNQEN